MSHHIYLFKTVLLEDFKAVNIQNPNAVILARRLHGRVDFLGNKKRMALRYYSRNARPIIVIMMVLLYVKLYFIDDFSFR